MTRVHNEQTRNSIMAILNSEIKIIDQMDFATVEVFSKGQSSAIVRLEGLRDKLEAKRVDIEARSSKSGFVEIMKDISSGITGLAGAVAVPSALIALSVDPLAATLAGVAIAIATASVLGGSLINKNRDRHDIKSAVAANKELTRGVHSIERIINELSDVNISIDDLNDKSRILLKGDDNELISLTEYVANTKTDITSVLTDYPDHAPAETEIETDRHSPS